MHYKNQQVLLASKHQKERVIGPVFFDKLQCKIFTSDFDTDQFGTFTGEVPRPQNAYETCILKAKTAAIATNNSLSIASEGSFGTHPAIPFLASDHEIMVFVDLKKNWVIAEQLVTPKTNYKMLTLHPGEDIEPFLHSVEFGSHALTIQVNNTKEIIAKGIKDKSELNKLIKKGFTKTDELLLATDMRAMMNPSRMEIISLLAEKLAARILSCCNSCGAPGFGFIKTEENLSCSLCDGPTSFHRFEIWGCIACDNKEKKPRQDNLEKADPTYCNHCNP